MYCRLSSVIFDWHVAKGKGNVGLVLAQSRKVMVSQMDSSPDRTVQSIFSVVRQIKRTRTSETGRSAQVCGSTQLNKWRDWVSSFMESFLYLPLPTDRL